MKPKILLLTGAIAFVIFIGSFVYAGGMGGGGMGGGSNGMMGGGHMMGYGQGYSNPWQDQYNPNPFNNNRYDRSDDKAYQDNAKETERLRQEIREKRQELSELYRSAKPDVDQIDKKIDELSKLENDLDRRLSGSQFQRR